jgi:hypothetical protein
MQHQGIEKSLLVCFLFDDRYRGFAFLTGGGSGEFAFASNLRHACAMVSPESACLLARCPSSKSSLSPTSLLVDFAEAYMKCLLFASPAPLSHRFRFPSFAHRLFEGGFALLVVREKGEEEGCGLEVGG